MATRTYANRHTYTHVLQCSPASVGLAQTPPNYTHSQPSHCKHKHQTIIVFCLREQIEKL